MESKTVLLVLCLAIATCLIVERVEATFGWLKNGGGGKQEFLRRVNILFGSLNSHSFSFNIGS